MLSRDLAVAVLNEAGLDREARRVRRCGRDWMIGRCTRNGAHVGDVPILCGHRMCPECAPRRAAKFAAAYVPGVAKFRYPVAIALTVANLADILGMDNGENPLRALRRAFSKLRRRHVFAGHQCKKKCRKCPLAEFHRHHGDGGAWCRACRCPGARVGVRAGLVKTECTSSAIAGWHPHLHVICDLGADGAISQFWLGWEWADAARSEGFRVGDYPIQIHAIKEGLHRGADGRVRYLSRAQAVAYAVKYASKDDIPDRDRWKWARVIKGQRLLQPFGTLHPAREVDGWIVTETTSGHAASVTPWPRASHPWMVVRPDGTVRKGRRAPICKGCVKEWANVHAADEIADAGLRELVAPILAEHAQVVAEVRKLRDHDEAARELLWRGAPVSGWRPVGLFSTLLHHLEDLDPAELDEALVDHVQLLVKREAEVWHGREAQEVPLQGVPEGRDLLS